MVLAPSAISSGRACPRQLLNPENSNSENFFQLQSTLGVLGISLGLAFLMNIAVESPVAHLDNFIFKKLMGKIIGEPQNAKEAEVSSLFISHRLGQCFRFYISIPGR